jgi:hypothetical protein
MRTLATALLIVLAAGAAAAATAPDMDLKPMASHHATHRPRPKPALRQVKSRMPDPNAGTSDQGAPNGAVTNGGQLAK